MANIAYDNSTTISGTSGSFTVTGSFPILFALIRYQSGTLTGATYAGVAMTQVTSFSVGVYSLALYVLRNPATGSNTLATSGATTVKIQPISYTSSSPYKLPDVIGTPVSGNNAGLGPITLSPSVTTVRDNSWTLLLGQFNGTSLTASTGTTARQNDGTGLFIGDSNGQITPPGSTSMSITLGAENNYYFVVVSFAPYLPILAGVMTLSLIQPVILVAYQATVLIESLSLRMPSFIGYVVGKWATQAKSTIGTWTRQTKS